LRLIRLLSLLGMAAQGLPGPAGGQLLFDWPIRATPQPEAILTGAGAVFWNPGGLAQGVGTGNEVWITHVDGPDATGIRGVAVAAVLDLPLGLQTGMGYWHLGIPDIPRTTDSPLLELGRVEVAEDVFLFSMTGGDRDVPVGFGGSVRFHRASVAGEVRTRMVGDVGVHLQPPVVLSPRFGLSLRGLGEDPRILAGVELAAPPLALRASWVERFHLGAGLTNWRDGGGWTTLWMVGLDVDRYSLSILRENLANGFGPVHFYRASIRLPGSDPG
jgi:hypothetical protein